MNEIFNDELKKLRGRFMEMGINTSEQIYKATKALIDRDVALAKEVGEHDRLINDGETYLEKHAFKLMNIQKPKENEFRSIMSILKASSDLERMADHASHIARDAIRIKGMDQHWPDIENDIAEMAETVRYMLEKALDAYVYTDEQTAYSVANMDLEVDKQYVQVHEKIINQMHNHPELIKDGSHHITVIHLLERIGDHIVNLVEWVIYAGTGKITELNPGKADPELVNRELQKQAEEQEKRANQNKKS